MELNITDLTIKNTFICPAAYNIVEALKKAIPMSGKKQK